MPFAIIKGGKVIRRWDADTTDGLPADLRNAVDTDGGPVVRPITEEEPSTESYDPLLRVMVRVETVDQEAVRITYPVQDRDLALVKAQFIEMVKARKDELITAWVVKWSWSVPGSLANAEAAQHVIDGVASVPEQEVVGLLVEMAEAPSLKGAARLILARRDAFNKEVERLNTIAIRVEDSINSAKSVLEVAQIFRTNRWA